MSALQLCLYLFGGILAAFGVWRLVTGLLYVLGGLTCADPGPVLVHHGLCGAGVGFTCLVIGACMLVLARGIGGEQKRP